MTLQIQLTADFSVNAIDARNCVIINLLLLFLLLLLPWFFIPSVLKLAKVKMYVRNGYDGDSETVNVLARHTALKRCSELPLKYVGSWYRNVVSRGSAVQSVALFCRFLRRGCEPRLIIIEPYYYYFKAYPANSRASTQ